MSKRTEIAFIDSIDGDIASILIDGKSSPVDLPKDCLPRGAMEGDWLRVTFKLLPDMREQKKKQVKELLDDLENLDITKPPL